MRFQATGGFCGCTSLAVGVQVVCFFGLVRSLVTLCIVSSTEDLSLVGVTWTPGFQLACATMAVLGVWLAIRAGVGGLYKLESPLRDYFFYLLVLAVSDAYWASYTLFEGSLCASLVPEETRRMGSHIVCSITECFVVFWCVVFYILSLYFMFIVWSASEESKRGMQAAPELLEYIDKLYEELHDDVKGVGAKKGYGATEKSGEQLKASVAEYGGWHLGTEQADGKVGMGFVKTPVWPPSLLASQELDSVLKQRVLFEAPPNRNLDRLREQGRSVMRQVAEVMNNYPSLEFRIGVTASEPHPDDETGLMNEREMRLAQARADEVRNELGTRLGVKNRLLSRGLGYDGGFHGRHEEPRVLIYPN